MKRTNALICMALALTLVLGILFLPTNHVNAAPELPVLTIEQSVTIPATGENNMVAQCVFIPEEDGAYLFDGSSRFPTVLDVESLQVIRSTTKGSTIYYFLSGGKKYNLSQVCNGTEDFTFSVTQSGSVVDKNLQTTFYAHKGETVTLTARGYSADGQVTYHWSDLGETGPSVKVVVEKNTNILCDVRSDGKTIDWVYFRIYILDMEPHFTEETYYSDKNQHACAFLPYGQDHDLKVEYANPDEVVKREWSVRNMKDWYNPDNESDILPLKNFTSPLFARFIATGKDENKEYAEIMLLPDVGKFKDCTFERYYAEPIGQFSWMSREYSDVFDPAKDKTVELDTTAFDTSKFQIDWAVSYGSFERKKEFKKEGGTSLTIPANFATGSDPVCVSARLTDKAGTNYFALLYLYPEKASYAQHELIQNVEAVRGEDLTLNLDERWRQSLPEIYEIKWKEIDPSDHSAIRFMINEGYGQSALTLYNVNSDRTVCAEINADYKEIFNIKTVDPSPTPTVTPTSEPTATVTPTVTAKPTATTAPATATPTPSKTTPVPTSATPTVTVKPTSATKPTAAVPTDKITPTTKAGPTSVVTPTTSEPDPKKQIMDFVERIYKYVLDREPEAEGAAFWTDELYSFRRTGGEVGLGFIFSDEFTNRNLSDEDFVTVLYNTFFGREPEAEGFAFWTGALKDGTLDRFTVASGFVYSQEWADTCASYGIRSGGELKPGQPIPPTDLTYAFVERMYTTAMERASDEEGAEFWANELSNFRFTGEQVGLMFFLSDEMEGFGLTDEEYVTRLYKTFMDREPEEGGFKFWIGYLKDGGAHSDVVYGFTRSEEFVNKCIEARILPY